ncbi:hypothetical protein ACH4TY_19460 [Streptomyces anulatus]
MEESQRNNLLPVGVTTAVLGAAYLAWALFRRAAPVPREEATRAPKRPGRLFQAIKTDGEQVK